MNPVLFLDRDGVLNQETGDYITSPDELIPVKGALELLQTAKQAGYTIIVITNQGGIAKKLYTHNILTQIHQKLHSFYSGLIDDIYYCPHHPDFSGKCLCRKPQNLLIEKAIYLYHADRKKSLFIGDRERDIEAATKSQIHGYLIESNQLNTLPGGLF